MRLLSIPAFFATLAAAQQLQGFNYGATYSDNSPIPESGYEALFNAAQNLQGNSNAFTSARLFTSIQAGTTNTPSEAFQAAVNTKTSLLLGLWGSAGQANIDNELAAIESAIGTFGSRFTDLVVGISVGSEDLYRISPTGIENESGVGAGPNEIASYINNVRSSLSGGPLKAAPVGHVDTWTAWVNGSNNAVIEASAFIGFDAYPYFQFQNENGIDNAESLFFSAYDQTVAVVGGKPIWVTETGWPVSGKTERSAVPSTDNAKRYWDEVGCGRLFGKVNTFWFTLQDSFPTTPDPSFGIVGKGSSSTDVPTTGLFDLSCSGTDASAPSSSVVASANAGPSADAAGSTGGGNANTPPAGGNEASSGEQKAAAPAPAKEPAAGPAANAGPTAPAAPVPTTLITTTAVLPGAATAAPELPSGGLGDKFEFPHLIIPVSSDKPDVAQGTSYNGTISSTTSSIFNFDFPADLGGKTCNLVFLLPKQSDLETSAFTLSSHGGLKVERLKEPATEQTTYNHQPAVDKDLGGPELVEPGSEYVIASGSCVVGARVGYKLSAVGKLDLSYFQDYNPSPIGLFVTIH